MVTRGDVRRVLVANRGEIALRVMRTCRELGIATVAVYGPDEIDAPHALFADAAYRIETDAPIPYLDVLALLNVAARSGADSVHPGYGFLAESAPFARACAEAGLTFIGPPASAIAAMGDKIAARRLAQEAGVSIVPGTGGAVDAAEAAERAESLGYPVAFKAAGGGGGRGFRVAWSARDVDAALRGASGEAERYFGDSRVYVERYLDHPRHVEIQLLADAHGRLVSLGERDCSVQRRHQKLIEECPSPAVDEALRRAMSDAAIRLAERVGYVSAGTVEFLLQDGEFFFLEMNTRIQVEHPITEMVTGVDIVREQIRIARGERLELPGLVKIRGHSIECRINAEDPGAGFAPTPGTIASARLPGGLGVRVDGVIADGTRVLPHYDSLIGKLVVWGADRDEAVRRMGRALGDLEVSGVATTRAFHEQVLRHPSFVQGDYDTRFLDRYPEVIERLDPDSRRTTVDHRPDDDLTVERYLMEVNGKRFDVRAYLPASTKRRPPKLGDAKAHSPSLSADGREVIVSPIQGTVLSVAVQLGDEVRAGDVVCVVEAMKMENEIAAGRDGIVTELTVTAGQTVQTGAVIATIEDRDAAADGS
jgi:acetyl-CoA/propionyl-CoA carboxylase, biotin carboxylase, biotin carboxyl carrier protein